MAPPGGSEGMGLETRPWGRSLGLWAGGGGQVASVVPLAVPRGLRGHLQQHAQPELLPLGRCLRALHAHLPPHLLPHG